jgi:hypothetical protein
MVNLHDSAYVNRGSHFLETRLTVVNLYNPASHVVMKKKKANVAKYG